MTTETSTTQTSATTYRDLLVEQLDWHWTNQLRPRLDGLTDEEYLWEPTPGAWNIRPRGQGTTGFQGGAGNYTIDWEYPPPSPAPVTTIAWRLAHITIGVFAMRVHGHFGGPVADYETWDYAGTAQGALTQLDDAYAAWLAGVRTWSDADLLVPSGPAEGPWHEIPRAGLILHINREVIHHGAEIALLRDLWAHRND